MGRYRLGQLWIACGLGLADLLRIFGFLRMSKINDKGVLGLHDQGQYDRLWDQHKLVC